MPPLDPASWKPVFDFLEQETKFQTAAAAITAGAAAWWLKSLIAPAKEAPKPSHPRLSKTAAVLLAIAAFGFYIDEGRLAVKYGQLARALAFGETVPEHFASTLVRDVFDLGTWPSWYPYYLARLVLLVVGIIVITILFLPPKAAA